MCGICGLWDEQRRLAPIVNMNQIQYHRGPDDEGYLFVNTATHTWTLAGGVDTPDELQLVSHEHVAKSEFNLALGSRRLAILDLSPAGHMPLSYNQGTLWITYNGEVYNYREIRLELEAKGHSFVSGSDTEVILAAYAEWGVDCLSKMNGMFAFAIWDSNQSQIFCARDRFGIKPLYYYWNGSTFIFASEIKSLLQHPVTPRVPNEQVIFDYLVLGLSDHSEDTFFEEIQVLPPAHFALFSTTSKQMTTHRWWQAEINPDIEYHSKQRQERHYDEFAGLLEDAVRLRLRSDVAVGSSLSGGLDSSAIVCLANRLLLNEQVIPKALVGEHQKTFTSRFREAIIDEYKYSHLIVEQTGADEYVTYPSAERLWEEIESFVWHLDEPVNSTSQYAQWTVMRLVNQNNVTVLLDGQGGDEILAGYYAYYPHYLRQLRQQSGLLTTLKAGWDVSQVGGAPVRDILWSNAAHKLPWRLQRIAEKIYPPRLAPGQGGSGLQSWQIQPEFLQRFWERRWRPDGSVDANGLVGVLYKDLTSTNLPKLLRYEDRNSMAFSIETRLPFLDFRVVEKVFSLPLNYRIHKGWSKWILRRSLSELLPKEVAWRRSKLGYPTPEESWLAQGSSVIRQILQENADAGYLKPYFQSGVLTNIAAQSDSELAKTPGLWRIVNLILWYELMLKSNAQSFAHLHQVHRHHRKGERTLPKHTV